MLQISQVERFWRRVSVGVKWPNFKARSSQVGPGRSRSFKVVPGFPRSSQVFSGGRSANHLWLQVIWSAPPSNHLRLGSSLRMDWFAIHFIKWFLIVGWRWLGASRGAWKWTLSQWRSLSLFLSWSDTFGWLPPTGSAAAHPCPVSNTSHWYD